MQRADHFTASNVPSEAAVTLPSGNRTLRVWHDEAGWRQSESEPGIFSEEHQLDYVVGSGMNGFSFITQRGDYLFQAPLSLYSKTKQWSFSPGYEAGDLGFSRPVAEECLSCHSARPQPIPHRNGAYLKPPFSELAIGCENCHGPGSRHVIQPASHGSIVNPAKLSPRLAEDICSQCHQGGDTRVLLPGKRHADFRPGEPLLNTLAIFKVPPRLSSAAESDLLEHNSAMKMSRCFRASGGKLSCLTCHDPHVQPKLSETESYYRKACATCHNDASCKLPLPARIQQAGANNCIACHMPKRQVAVISHAALTNHRIPSRPNEQLPPAAEQNDNADLMLVNKPEGRSPSIPPLTLLRAYGDLASQQTIYRQHYLDTLNQLATTDANNPLVQSALGHKALSEGKNEEAIEHLTAGLPLGETTVYSDLAQALTNLGRPAEAAPYLETAVQRDPYNATLRKTLTLTYIKLRRYAEATDQMRTYVDQFPQDSFMRDLLRRVDHQ